MNASLEPIARTGYLTSVVSYLVFWLADLARPGFVARYLSVHVFLVSALVFGAIWLHVVREWRERPILVYLAGILLGFVLATLVWDAGEGLAEFRILMTVVAVFVPMTCLRLLRS